MNNLLTSEQAEAFNRGFSAGAKKQREEDIRYLINLLKDLEKIPGVGGRTALKIQTHILEKFAK